MPLKKVLQKSLRMLSWIIRSVFALHSEWKRTLFGKAQKVAHLCWFLSIPPLFSSFYFLPLHLLLKVCDFLGQALPPPGFMWHIWGSSRKCMLVYRQHSTWNKAVALQKKAIDIGFGHKWSQPIWTWTKGHTSQWTDVPSKAHDIMGLLIIRDAMLRQLPAKLYPGMH